MKIKVTSVYVDDQDKALRFYTEILGFAKKTDFSQGPYRWLTVASPEEPEGTELQLALNNNPAAKAYQQALFQQSQPAAMFFTDDVQADYERMMARGAQFCRFWSAHVDALERHLSANTWALAAVTVVLIAYPIARIVIPAVLNGIVPDVVRTVLNLI